MKIEIFDEKKQEEEKVLRLKLIKDRDKVCLVSITDDGDIEYYLMAFHNDGTVYGNRAIGKETGLKLNEIGKIILE